MRRVTVTSPPAASSLDELLTLGEAMAFLGVDSEAEEGTVRLLLDAVRSGAETALGVCLALQRLRYVAPAGPRGGPLERLDAGGRGLSLPRTPVRSIERVSIHAGGAETVLEPEAYRLRFDDLVITEAPRVAEAIQVEFWAGYGTNPPPEPEPGDPPSEADVLPVPDFARRALLAALADAYEFRETIIAGASVTVLPERITDHFSGLVRIDL